MMNQDPINTVHCMTQGIVVQVEVEFQTNYSIPFSDQNVFTYYIRITNTNNFTVQLLRRHWLIWESNGTSREVKGEGVIGEQPIIHPKQFHSYESFCPIHSPIGKMKGKYQMQRMDTNQVFEIEIPEFQLVINSLKN